MQGEQILKTRTLTHAVLANLLAASTLVLSAGSSAYVEELLVPTSKVSPSDVLKSKSAEFPVNPKVGLVLGGGGSRGAAEVGVLEVFEREGLKFDYIVGTSIGSIVGGLYDAGVPMSKLHEEFESARAMRHFMPISLPVGIMLEPIMLGARLFGAKPYDGLYPGWIFRKIWKR